MQEYSFVVSEDNFNNSFKVIGYKTKKQFILRTSCPLSKGDLVIGSGIKEEDGSITDNNPLVIPTRNADQFVELFGNLLEKENKSGWYSSGKRKVKLTRKEINICLLSMAELYTNDNSTEITSDTDFIISEASAGLEIYGTLEDNNPFVRYSLDKKVHDGLIKLFLSIWKKERIERLLKVYGIIDDNVLLPNHIVIERLTKGKIFSIPFLDFDKASSLSTITQSTYTSKDVKLLQLQNILYRHLENKKLYVTSLIKDPKHMDLEADLNSVSIANINIGGVKHYLFDDVLHVYKSVLHKLNMLSGYGMNNFIVESNLNDDQMLALEMVANNPISCIVGAAGSGKSYLIKELANNGFKVLTPTAKAAERLKELNIPACTVHSGKIIIAESSMLVIDEASMLDASLLKRLLTTGKNLKKIVFVGDPYQLPPVKWGHIFGEIVKMFSTIELTRNMRFSNNSSLFSTRLNEYVRGKGDIEDIFDATYRVITLEDYDKLEETYKELSNKYGETTVNIYVDNQDKPLKPSFENLVSTYEHNKDIISSITFEINKRVQIVQMSIDEVVSTFMDLYRHDTDVCVITPYRVLSKDINDLISKAIKADTDDIFFKGQTVMCLRNYREVKNGMIGTVSSLNSESIFVAFNTGVIEFSRSKGVYPNISHLEIAYSITIHKAQGSEWKRTIVYIPKFSNFVDRSLIYTGLTRYKLGMIISASKDVLISGLENIVTHSELLNKL